MMPANLSSVNERRQLSVRALQIWDVLVLAVALTIACHPQWSSATLQLSPSSFWTIVAWSVSSTVIWHVSLSTANLYVSRRLSGYNELLDTIKGVSVGCAMMAVLGLALNIEFVTLNVIALVWLITTSCLMISRFIMRRFLVGLRHRGRNLRNILIVGSGAQAQRVADECKNHTELGYNIIGFIDDKQENPETVMLKNSPGLLGGLSDLPDILAQNSVDEVFIALPMKTFYASVAKVIQNCQEQGVLVRLPLDLFEIAPDFRQIDVLGDTPILSYVPNWSCDFYMFIKRSIDIVIPLIMLIILIPFFLFISLAIVLDSPGNPIFVQKRAGLNKRVFKIYKFRTMTQNQENIPAHIESLNEASGPVFKIHNDPRVTRLGKFLRSSSIDELPQLINVLLGDMSLVGPRPLPLRDVNGFELDWQRRRFSVKPGISCIWQISGRSSISFDKWMELDMEYIEQRSIWLDFKILVQTLPAILKRKGAY